MEKIELFKNGEYTVTTDLEKVDFDAVCEMLSKSYWANNRSKEIIIKSFKNSLCFSLFYKDEQIGIARVITDRATFAYLCDVYIDENYRGNGLGKWLIGCVFNHKDLQNLRRWSLGTRDAHEFYKNFGFVSLSTPERFMEIFNG